LHGTAITVRDVYSTDDKSEIIHYDCDVKSVVYELEYSFHCITENSLGNKETISVTVPIREANNRLDPAATECVIRHYASLDNVTSEYPDLLDLPNESTNLTKLKNYHIKKMDGYYQDRDYASAKKHATIILKYFNINDLQALSTLGNMMRDEDRNNVSAVQCAIAVHSTTLLFNLTWGKIALAEDYYVLGDFEEATRLSSLITDAYYPDHHDIPVVSYKNALIVKANALFRIAMSEKADDIDDVRMHYSLAHEIEKSYDTWFGLGNLDRYKGDFESAKEKYLKAKEIVVNDSKDTTEIDNELERVNLYLSQNS